MQTITRSATPGSLRLRSEPGASPDAPTTAPGGATLSGHFALFNLFTEIDSAFEGHFLERIAPGAFLATFAHDRDRIRALFQHGADPHIGDKPLGPILTLREDELGAFYEVQLLETQYVAELVPGLRAGTYGASFRFKVLREEYVENPGPSDHNPRGLPERTILETQVLEFGPVTFPAYPAATASVGT